MNLLVLLPCYCCCLSSGLGLIRLSSVSLCLRLSTSLYLSPLLIVVSGCCCWCWCWCCCSGAVAVAASAAAAAFFVSWRVLIRFLFPSLSMLTTNSHVCSPLLMFLMSRIPSTRFQSQNELSGANLQRRGIWRCGRQMRSSIDAGVVDVCVQRSICSALDEFTPVHRWEENRGAPRALVYVTFDL